MLRFLTVLAGMRMFRMRGRGTMRVSISTVKLLHSILWAIYTLYAAYMHQKS